MRSLYSRALGAAAAFAGAAVLGLGAAAAYAAYHLDRRRPAPAPEVRADPRPEAIARGGQLFRSLCLECHRGPDGRPTGRQLDMPRLLGTFYAPNLTVDAAAGIGRWSDADLARLIRTGVRPDGRLAPAMPEIRGLSDADLAALLGFIRSGDPLLAPDPAAWPRSRLTLFGKLVVTFAAEARPAPRAAATPPARPPGPGPRRGASRPARRRRGRGARRARRASPPAGRGRAGPA